MATLSALGCTDANAPAAGDPILTQATVTLPAFQGVDLETGTLTNDSTTDLYIRPLGDPLHFELVPHGARSAYVYFGATPPTLADCRGGLGQKYWVDTLPHDVYSCIWTAAGHKGYFHFAAWPPFGMDSVRIAYVLWKP